MSFFATTKSLKRWNWHARYGPDSRAKKIHLRVLSLAQVLSGYRMLVNSVSRIVEAWPAWKSDPDRRKVPSSARPRVFLLSARDRRGGPPVSATRTQLTRTTVVAEEAKFSVKRLTEKQDHSSADRVEKMRFQALRATVRIRSFHLCYAERTMCCKLGEYLLNFISLRMSLYINYIIQEWLYSLFYPTSNDWKYLERVLQTTFFFNSIPDLFAFYRHARYIHGQIE